MASVSLISDSSRRPILENRRTQLVLYSLSNLTSSFTLYTVLAFFIDFIYNAYNYCGPPHFVLITNTASQKRPILTPEISSKCRAFIDWSVCDREEKGVIVKKRKQDLLSRKMSFHTFKLYKLQYIVSELSIKKLQLKVDDP